MTLILIYICLFAQDIASNYLAISIILPGVLVDLGEPNTAESYLHLHFPTSITIESNDVGWLFEVALLGFGFSLVRKY